MVREEKANVKQLFNKTDSKSMRLGFHFGRIRIWRILNRRSTSGERRIMPVRLREVKVFAALVVSMAVGIIILRALGNNPPSAGAFCLSRYTKVIPVEEAILSRAVQPSGRWGRIGIYYSGTKAGNIQQLAFLSGLVSVEDINCHFVICNGLGGGDGQIQPTEKWQRQWLVTRESPNYEPRSTGGGQTIYICVIADGQTVRPTDLQKEMTEALVQGLCREFDIQSESIHYPAVW